MAKKLEGEKKRALARIEKTHRKAAAKIVGAALSKMGMLKRIEKARSDTLDACWEYHGDLINSVESGDDQTTRETLEDVLYDLELTEWEDVGYFVGYLRGLNEAREIINKTRGV